MMLSAFILLVIICSLISTGFYSACQFDGDEEYDKATGAIKTHWPKPTSPEDGAMILWWVRYYGGRYISYFWTKPLYSCIICMGSFHSIIPTALYCYVTGTPYWIWPFIAFATVGLNTHVSKWWNK